MATLAAVLGAFVLFSLACFGVVLYLILTAPRGCETDESGYRECDDCDSNCLDEMTAIEIERRLAQ